MPDKRFVRIVVASPSDVNKERNALQRVVNQLNREVGTAIGVHLELSRWETDTFPAFHVDGAQGHIEDILRIEECDILICIFGRRFGTRTKRARSGTESEFKRAYKSLKDTGKPHIMLYFEGGLFTPANPDEQEQWDALQTFRKRVSSEALFWEFDTSRDFARLVKHHLITYLAKTPRSVLYRVPLTSLSTPSNSSSSKRYNKSRNEFHIRANVPLRRPGTDLRMPVSDFDVEVTARKVSGSNTSWYGVYLVQGRGTNNVKYHDFFVSGKGTFTYEVKTMNKDETEQKDFKIILPAQLGTSVRPGNSSNRLRLVRHGRIVEFWANDSQLLQASTTLKNDEQVQVGVVIHTEQKLAPNQHMEAAFSSWVFYEPE